jgi:hypothetical protein
MASGRFRRGDLATGASTRRGRGRGLVIVTRTLPRYVISKLLVSGTTAFYFNIPTLYRKLGCAIPNEPLGTDYAVACGEDGSGGRAAALNDFLMNGPLRGGASQSPESERQFTAQWIGFSVNTNKARHT